MFELIKATDWFLQQDKSKKRKNKNKQTNIQKRERKHLNLSCNILHDFVFFGIQWSRKNLRKRVRASTLRFLSTTRWGKLRTSSDVTLTRLFLCCFFTIVLMSSCLWGNTTTFVNFQIWTELRKFYSEKYWNTSSSWRVWSRHSDFHHRIQLHSGWSHSTLPA